MYLILTETDICAFSGHKLLTLCLHFGHVAENAIVFFIVREFCVRLLTLAGDLLFLLSLLKYGCFLTESETELDAE